MVLAAKELDDLIATKGINVYMYDTTAISRAPTVALSYLCLCKRRKNWQDLDKCEEHLKSCHPIGCPNIRMVKKCIEENSFFQDCQYDFYAEMIHKS